MSTPLGFLERLKLAIISLFKGPKGAAPPSHQRRDDTTFQCNPGSGGFVDARILKNRLKGNIFEWRRVGVPPADGSRFEIRPKKGMSSLLEPAIPQGRDLIMADANGLARPGDIYKYSLWQVLSDGSEKELHDPEIEIAQF